jgi:hypothetical protein
MLSFNAYFSIPKKLKMPAYTERPDFSVRLVVVIFVKILDNNP